MTLIDTFPLLVAALLGWAWGTLVIVEDADRRGLLRTQLLVASAALVSAGIVAPVALALVVVVLALGGAW